MTGTFPFGAPVLERGTEVPDRPFPVLVLGAYPSALHVRWTPPAGLGRPVTALPVDNEPTPFWDGKDPDADQLFETWRDRWFQPGWGTVAPAALNGSSGRDLVQRWLHPLGYDGQAAFITDCLPTARASTGVAVRLEDRYAPFATATGAPPAALGSHPGENAIVTEALAKNGDRIRAQLEAAEPGLVISLGNAAARVLAALAGQPERSGVLTADSYGQERRPVVDGRELRWQALVHPAAPRVWAQRHDDWRSAL